MIVVSTLPIAPLSVPGPLIADRAGDLEIDHAGLIFAAEHDDAAADLEVTRREQRQRDIDLVERERAEHAALAPDLALRRRLLAAEPVRKSASERSGTRPNDASVEAS